MCGVSLQAQRQSKSAREIGADAEAPYLVDPFCFTFAVRSGSANISWKIHFLHLGHHQWGFGKNKASSVTLLNDMIGAGGSQSSWWKTKTGMKTQCGKELEEVQERI